MKQIIINADDLGYSNEVNSQIEKCIHLGVITSSTLMANAPGFEDGVRIAQEYKQISFGVHLNLVEFSPLTNLTIFKRHGIVGKDGKFIDGAIFVTKIDHELEQAIFEEWDAQISKIKNAGITPSHVDSHQHTHTINQLQEILCRVLIKHNIKKIRRKFIPSIRIMLFGKKTIKVVHDKSKAIQPPKRNILYRRLHLLAVICQSVMWNKKMSKHFQLTDSFCALRVFYLNRPLLSLRNNTVVELMSHPGQETFKQETEKLMQILAWLPKDYQLINYFQLFND